MEEKLEKEEAEFLKKIEAILFISGRFLNMQELISLSDLNPVIIKKSIKKLQERYNLLDSAIEIVEKNEMWKMDVKPEYFHIVNKLASGNSEFTKAEQETLAVIALKQPIKQSAIIRIRGNKAYDHLKKFDDLNLIKRKKVGHTYEVKLSEGFYDYFNINKEGAIH